MDRESHRQTGNPYLLEIKDLSFAAAFYREDGETDYAPILKDVSLSVREGEFVALCGRTGCGKSTLLSLCKHEIAPNGRQTGQILYRGQDPADLPEKQMAAEIGYVGQDPEHGCVTDRVWHELAFGAENLGMPEKEMRRRVAETAAYFNMEPLFLKDVDQLSGGEKQLLNLSAVMVLQPRLLILDEPTAQLDPIAAENFLSTLKKLNREFGIAILIAEHRLEDVLPMADRIAVMEGGTVITECPVRGLADPELLSGLPSCIGRSLPCALQMYSACRESRRAACAEKAVCEEKTASEKKAACKDKTSRGFDESFAKGSASEGPFSETVPLTVGDGRLFLKNILAKRDALFEQGKSDQGLLPPELPNNVRSDQALLKQKFSNNVQTEKALLKEEQPECGRFFRQKNNSEDLFQTVLSLKEICFRYDRGMDRPAKSWTVDHLSLSLHSGEIFCLLGGNGSGKTTALKLAAGILKPDRGKRTVQGRPAYLPQDPEILFSGDSVGEELGEDEIPDFPFSFQPFKDRHPYDLSGGEKQLLALAILLRSHPEILLLDEPAKGLDREARDRLLVCLKALKRAGKAILLVTHDVEFAADCADRCAFFFRGGIISEDTPRTFFTQNLFYTTQAARIGGEFWPEVFLTEELLEKVRYVYQEERDGSHR